MSMELVEKTESQDELVENMPRNGKTTSARQIAHLKRCREIKQQKQELKLQQQEHYTKELKSVYQQLDYLNSSLTSLIGVVREGTKRIRDESVGDASETPFIKKQKTAEKEIKASDREDKDDKSENVMEKKTGDYNYALDFMDIISKALGMGVAAGVVALARYKYRSLYAENSHLNKYDHLH